MIAFLSGEIIHKSKNYVFIRTGDIGYKVYIKSSLLAELAMGGRAEFFTYHHVKEDSEELFGFSGTDELEMFELLISISGVGPKTALGVLSMSDVDSLKDSISRGDAGLLTKVSGIGNKTAERIVLELRGKISHLEKENSGKNAAAQNYRSDEIDALMALGYSLVQARDALNSIDPGITGSGERIRQALRAIGGK